jgi:DNA-binding NtrC family response regulator
MHAMIVDHDAERLDHSQIAFLEAGIHVTGSGSLAVAETCLRRAVVDVLVLDAECGPSRIASLTALAQRRNPRLVTLILTDDVAATTDLYSDAVTSLHCVLDGDVSPRMVARMAQASLAGRAACRLVPAQSERAAQATAQISDQVPVMEAARGPAMAPVSEPVAPQPVFSTTRRKPAVPARAALHA